MATLIARARFKPAPNEAALVLEKKFYRDTIPKPYTEFVPKTALAEGEDGIRLLITDVYPELTTERSTVPQKAKIYLRVPDLETYMLLLSAGWSEWTEHADEENVDLAA